MIQLKKVYYLFIVGLLLAHQSEAQEWVKKMEDPSVNFYEVKQSFDQAWGNQPYVRGKGYKQYKRWEYFMEDRCYPHGKRPQPNKAWKEHYKFQSKYRPDQSFAMRSANWTPLGPASWTNTSGWNPGNGRINCVEVDPNNSSIIYAGAPSGGLWKSTNGGSNWTCLTDDLPVLGVSAILVDPNNSNHIYMGTGDGDGSDTYSIGVLKSTDAGQTWTTTGLSWNTTNGRLIRRMIMHPTNNQIILAATNNGIYHTNDAGQTWTQTQGGSMRDVEFKPGDPNTVYACTDEVYKSTDGGLSFVKITTGLPSANDVNRASIAVTPSNPDYLYVLYGDASNSGYYGLYRSTNSGTSFSLRSNTPNIFTYDETGSGSGGQSWYDMALAVSPTNADEVYSGGINVWKSSDGGVNWTILTHWVHPATLGYVHADIHTLDFFGNNLYCGSDGGLSLSTNAGNTWNNLSFGMEIMQFYRFGVSTQNAYQIIGGTQDNGTNYLNNNWVHVLGGDGMEAAIDYSNSQIMYGETQNGGMNRSTDGGQSWTGISPNNAGAAAWVTPYIIDPNDPTTLYAGYEEVWKSTNRGNSWSAISSFGTGTTLRYIAAAASNSNYIYAGTNGTLYKTTNGGNSWSTITPNLPNNSAIKYLTIDPVNPDRIWIALSGFNNGEKVFYSPDGGANWQNISANLPNLPINCIVYQNGSADGLYVGTDVGIYYTDNSLANWQPFMTGLPNVIVNELEIHYGVSKIRAATYGRGIWESDLFAPSPFPPSAAFSYDMESLCQGDSIKFYDQSLNAAPGWQWLFPGGSPASSTDQSPVVYYGTAGTYTATLIVSNANGADTITQNVSVNFAPNQVDVQILLDNYPEETTWEIADLSGTIVASGGPYAGPGTSVTETVCIDDGCFNFTINDSYGDGICCGFGNGNYQVLDAQGTLLASGGQFASQEVTQFCFNQTAPLSVGNVSSTVAGCNLSNGAVTITANGGDGSYQYSLDGINYQSSNSFSGLAAGSYTVYVLDGQGQTASSTIAVQQSAGPTAVAAPSSLTLYLDQGATMNFISVLSTNATAYLWEFGDGTSSTQPNPSHTYTAVGNYEAVLTTYRDSCIDRDTAYITVELTSGLQPTSQVNSFDILPNPFQEQFDIVVDFQEPQEAVEISVHNALGQQLYWEKLTQPVQGIQQHLHFGNFADGWYFVTIKTNQFTLSKKVVKANP